MGTVRVRPHSRLRVLGRDVLPPPPLRLWQMVHRDRHHRRDQRQPLRRDLRLLGALRRRPRAHPPPRPGLLRRERPRLHRPRQRLPGRALQVGPGRRGPPRGLGPQRRLGALRGRRSRGRRRRHRGVRAGLLGRGLEGPEGRGPRSPGGPLGEDGGRRGEVPRGRVVGRVERVRDDARGDGGGRERLALEGVVR